MKNTYLYYAAFLVLFCSNKIKAEQKDKELQNIDKQMEIFANKIKEGEYENAFKIIEQNIQTDASDKYKDNTHQYINEYGIERFKLYTKKYGKIHHISCIRNKKISDFAYKKIYTILIGAQILNFEISFMKMNNKWYFEDFISHFMHTRSELYSPIGKHKYKKTKNPTDSILHNPADIDMLMNIFTEHILKKEHQLASNEITKYYQPKFNKTTTEYLKKYINDQLRWKVEEYGNLEKTVLIDNEMISDWAYRKTYAFKYKYSIVKYEITFFKYDKDQWFMYDAKYNDKIDDLYK
ncbi:MAG: hypothetical protein N4A49_02035 [Marinifilaceae bacterium]|jgi:hypothetical protein|nr:hypothetical protein [Marinifilaceae bacterium]